MKRKSNFPKKVLKEIGKEFLNLIFGNVYNRIGLSLLIFLIGSVIIFAPMEDKTQKPKWFFIVGGLFIAISLMLVIKRYLQLKIEMESENRNGNENENGNENGNGNGNGK